MTTYSEGWRSVSLVAEGRGEGSAARLGEEQGEEGVCKRVLLQQGPGAGDTEGCHPPQPRSSRRPSSSPNCPIRLLSSSPPGAPLCTSQSLLHPHPVGPFAVFRAYRRTPPSLPENKAGNLISVGVVTGEWDG
ncbi:hypothetical protein NDU88_008543 [Pleurodeles waltl]|uniref:Uncharacterized protein n=1 Tax=Pleurodeles waltl TaxID=8319 RepID=A0AAV7N5D9_PLEWA|nr:hypothetical protein NDU88_008543 [Pleurodeles waltl]